MKNKTSGIILIVIGIIMIAYSGFTFVTTEKVVDLGPLEINREKEHHVKWPPFVGALLVITGSVIVVRNKS